MLQVFNLFILILENQNQGFHYKMLTYGLIDSL